MLLHFGSSEVSLMISLGGLCIVIKSANIKSMNKSFCGFKCLTKDDNWSSLA